MSIKITEQNFDTEVLQSAMPSIQQRQTVENAARQFSITFRDRLRRFPTRSLNFAAHRLRINKAIVIGIDDEAAGRK